MVPILFGSVLSLWVFLVRWLALRASRVRPSELERAVRAAVDAGDLAEAHRRCRASDTPLGRVLSAGFAHRGAPRGELKERMEEMGQREVAHLERYVGVVGVVASVEPLLGLLGTVTGMIGVFQGVVTEGVGDPATLASGIWSALITTAAGLSVGIPAFLKWRYLVSLVDRRAEELEAHAVSLLDQLSANPEPRSEAP
jgi:biopolymer transport protein ExbB